MSSSLRFLYQCLCLVSISTHSWLYWQCVCFTEFICEVVFIYFNIFMYSCTPNTVKFHLLFDLSWGGCLNFSKFYCSFKEIYKGRVIRHDIILFIASGEAPFCSLALYSLCTKFYSVFLHILLTNTTLCWRVPIISLWISSF